MTSPNKGRVRPATTKEAPSEERAKEISRPFHPPVTIATLFFSLMNSSFDRGVYFQASARHQGSLRRGILIIVFQKNMNFSNRLAL